ncbi:aldose epimerase family protein [Diplocloster modestus]|uniref:CPBP family intramembrane metalloprotease n=1 Tax=Diplocloster modestus TaxID=2850322 RepID=A0ABS6KEN6_9FIRM|nr:CPBP family glutamic-type intramembrane protease [Diplocloster modestus]MBU9728990.1 CPBP family intramembrane metalloprotease [Diplocloster modestus]
MGKEPVYVRIWKLLYPLGIKYLAEVVVTLAGAGIFAVATLAAGEDAGREYELVREYSNVILLVSNVLLLPVMWMIFRRDEEQGLHERAMYGKISGFWVVLLAVCGCVGFNGLIAFSPLPVWFPQGKEVLSTLYGGNKWIVLLNVIVAAPLAEELLFRGIVYSRLREYTGRFNGILCSAFIFGLLHGNVLQFVYAFLLGLIFAYLYEVYGSIKAPVAAHCTANLFSVLMTETPLGRILENPAVSYLAVAAAWVTGALVLVMMRGNRSKKEGECSMAKGRRRMENDRLLIEVDDLGAELTRIYDKYNKREVIWEGDPAYWKRHAPILFPFIGKVNGNVYRYHGKEYPSGQHGFARDLPFELKDQGPDFVSHTLEANDDTMMVYPFLFRLKVTHTLKGNRLKVAWKVTNYGNSTMYFSVGGHPAFQLPVDSALGCAGWKIRLGEGKRPVYRLLNAEGLCDMSKTYPLELSDGVYTIDEHTFARDALIFEGQQIKRAGIEFPDGTPYVNLICEDFPYLGIWSAQGAPFICLEPWFGRCDDAGFTGELAEKAGIRSLGFEESFRAEYTIEIC